MPFTNGLVKLADKSIKGPDDKGDAFTSMLDERLLDTPSVAIERSYAVAQRMAVLSAEALHRAMGMPVKPIGPDPVISTVLPFIGRSRRPFMAMDAASMAAAC